MPTGTSIKILKSSHTLNWAWEKTEANHFGLVKNENVKKPNK